MEYRAPARAHPRRLVGSVMASAPKLKVRVEADIDQYKRGLTQAEQETQGFSNKFQQWSANVRAHATAMFAAVAAGAAMLAVKLGKESVDAAMADEAAVAKLGQTLENLDLSARTHEVSGFIDMLQAETGVVDDELRPAFERLVRSTKDVGEAEKLTSLAVDIAAAKKKDLAAVSNALGKAVDGNTNALARLGLGLDTAIIQSGDLDAITAELSRLFNGQASTAAATYQGKLNLIEVAADEAKETIGYSLLNAVDDVSEALGGADGAVDLITELGQVTSYLIDDVGMLTAKLVEQTSATDDAGEAVEDETDLIDVLISMLGTAAPAMQEWRDIHDAVAAEAERHERAMAALAARYSGLAAQIAKTREEASNQAWGDRYTAQAEALGKTIRRAGGNLDEYIAKLHEKTRATTAGGSADDAAAKKIAELGRIVAETADDKLDPAIKIVKDLAAQMDAYGDSVADSVRGTVSLADAWQTQVDTRAAAEQGEGAAVSWLDAFRQQLTDAKEFGDILTQLQASGASQALVDQVRALGPGAGTALASEMIAGGMAPQLSVELAALDVFAGETGTQMAQTFQAQGVLNAVAMLQGIIDQVKGSEKNLRQIGRGIGAPIGAQIEDEIRDAIARATGAAKAAKDAAAASAYAAEMSKPTPVNVTFTGLVTDPVGVARQIKDTLAVAGMRVGA